VPATKPTIKVAVVGNPNTGKTSLLNSLLGLHMHVGNWPGKTVEKRSGVLEAYSRRLEITDLPGIYAIDAYSDEELVTREFLGGDVDVVVQVVDVNALERNLLLSFQIMALHKPLVLAFNFNIEACRRGAQINSGEISRVLQIPIVEIEAHTGKNKGALLEAVVQAAIAPTRQPDYVPDLADETGELHHQRTLAFIEKEVMPYYSQPVNGGRQEILDSVILSKYAALPLLFLVISLMFEATFIIAQPLVNLISEFFDWLGRAAEMAGSPPLVQSFVHKGLIDGLGTVISFTPLIFVLFAIIAALEDSGLLSRTIVAVDRLFESCGLSGRAFVPMVLGFGCNVPAIMAARTIRNKRERLIAIFVNPFMSCSARLPVYLLFTAMFFPRHGSVIVISLYFFGVFVAFLTSRVLSQVIPDGEGTSLILELPPYRLPRVYNMLSAAWHQTLLFLRKAGSFIFTVIVLIWLLASLPPGASYGSVQSIAGMLGKTIAPLLSPLGFGHWTFAVSLLFGLAGKEVIIGSLGTLHGVSGEALHTSLAQHITPAGAISFLIFVLLYSPCLGAISVVKQETGSWRFVLAQVAFSLIVAWLVSFAFFNIAQVVTSFY
jgi:ferrous iron transport protein B